MRSGSASHVEPEIVGLCVLHRQQIVVFAAFAYPHGEVVYDKLTERYAFFLFAAGNDLQLPKEGGIFPQELVDLLPGLTLVDMEEKFFEKGDSVLEAMLPSLAFHEGSAGTLGLGKVRLGVLRRHEFWIHRDTD